MAILTYDLKLVDEDTLQIKVGRAREYISVEHKDKAQLWDAVKWALISKGVYLSNERLTQELYDLIWQHR